MCQYCGCDSNSVIGRLMGEHFELVDLAGQVRRAVEADDVDALRLHGTRLAEELMRHAADEEAGIFPMAAQHPGFAPTIERLLQQHRELDELLEALLDQEPGAWERFDALQRRHFDEEENGLFPAIYVEFVAQDWQGVADGEHALKHARGEHHDHHAYEEAAADGSPELVGAAADADAGEIPATQA